MSKHAKSTRFHPLGGPGHDRAVMQERDHDAYLVHKKIPEPSYCPDCGAVFEQGRWQWHERLAATAPQVLCAACRRIRDHFPAGIVTVEGEFLRDHRDELLRLVHHLGDRAKAEHPMQRIMSIDEEGGTIEIQTTDVHLARGIGQALYDAYRGELEFKPSPDQDLIRVHWRR
jgi:NMD protein affecting ribosome stability and mRNA decay